MRAVVCLAALTVSGAALAQDHAAHEGHQQSAPAPQSVDHSQMDHSQMDHSQMGQPMPVMLPPLKVPPPPEAAPIPSGPPPAEAFTGPRHAADAYLGEGTMQQARADLAHEMGGMGTWQLKAERLEYRAHDGRDGYLWDVRGFIGGDINRFRFKSEGEGVRRGGVEDAEVQALYSRAIAPFFDLQAGVGQDLTGPTRTHAVVGIYGMAPYMFEMDANAFLSDKGDLTGQVEVELDQRITQRLILQPRTEISLSAQDIPELGIGAGVDKAELGVRLRYEFARAFAPYIGVEQEWRLGNSKDYARARGDDPSVTNFLVGVRFWF